MIEHRKALEIAYDDKLDILAVDGIRYDGNVFRSLGDSNFASPAGYWFQIVSNKDGILVLRKATTEFIADEMAATDLFLGNDKKAGELAND